MKDESHFTPESAEAPFVSPAPNSSAADFHFREVLTLSTGHAVHDTYTAFLPPLLPTFIEKFGLLKAEAGLLAVLLQIPSLIQPLIGHLSDRKNLLPLVITGPAVAAILMSLLGIAPGYGVLMLLLTVAGFNSAVFHAISPVVAGRLSGTRLGKGMGFWMVGGELGRTLGPLVVVSAVGLLTLSGLPLVMILGVFASFLLYLQFRRFRPLPTSGPRELPLWEALQRMKPIMFPLAGIIVLRAMMSASLSIYLPTFLTEEGSSLWIAGASLTVMEAAGMAGAFLGGSLSDRLGRRKVLALAQLVSALTLLAFVGLPGGLLRVGLLILLGFFLLSITPVIMALVLENFPENRALANGVYMSLSFVIRAGAILLVGTIGDLFGLHLAYTLSAGLMLAGLPLIWLLPEVSSRG